MAQKQRSKEPVPDGESAQVIMTEMKAITRSCVVIKNHLAMIT